MTGLLVIREVGRRHSSAFAIVTGRPWGRAKPTACSDVARPPRYHSFASMEHRPPRLTKHTKQPFCR